MEERRQFDRVQIPASARVHAEDAEGNRLGRIVMLGRGGCQVQTSRRFPPDVTMPLVIVAELDGIRRHVSAIHRFTLPNGEAGFEFQGIEPEAAVEIGVLVGKYFPADAAKNG
ncbi:MAG: PilZ domain-containing protein [Terriglobales bacterium]